MGIPKYMQQKILRHNEMIARAVQLEHEIDSWYADRITKTQYYNETPDEQLCEIKCGIEEVKYISLDSMLYNIETCENGALKDS